MKYYYVNYVIMKLSESKTTKGAFTYYVITERGGEVSKRLIHDYGGGKGGLALWWHKKSHNIF